MADAFPRDAVNEFCRDVAKRLKKVDEYRLRDAVHQSIARLMAQMQKHWVAAQEEKAKERRYEAAETDYTLNPVPRALPYSASSPVYEPLVNIIGRTAKQSRYTSQRCGLIMTYFLQNLSEMLSHGIPVTIPGFGIFIAFPYEQKGREPFVQPRFIAARTLRKQVATVTPMKQALLNKHRAERYRRHHHPSSKPDKQNIWVWKAMATFRKRMENYSGLPEKFVQ